MLFVLELKMPYYLAILELVQIVAIDHLWKVYLISLTEIDELVNLGPNFGLVLKSSGLNFGSEPNCGIPMKPWTGIS
jgi:hypothetical protein